MPDSEYVFKGITQWSDKWRRHGWRNSLGEVSHRDLWEQILWLKEGASELVQFRRVPSHLKVPGNDGADKLAMQGRLLHPSNLLPLRSAPGWWNGRSWVWFPCLSLGSRRSIRMQTQGDCREGSRNPTPQRNWCTARMSAIGGCASIGITTVRGSAQMSVTHGASISGGRGGGSSELL